VPMTDRNLTADALIAELSEGWAVDAIGQFARPDGMTPFGPPDYRNDAAAQMRAFERLLERKFLWFLTAEGRGHVTCCVYDHRPEKSHGRAPELAAETASTEQAARYAALVAVVKEMKNA
jgi:hypothetical protein